MSQTLGVAVTVHRPIELAGPVLRAVQAERQLEALLEPGPALGEVVQRSERLLEAGRRLESGVPRCRDEAGLTQVNDRLVPVAGLPVVRSERQRMESDVVGMQRFQGRGDVTMEQRPAGGDQVGVVNLAYLIVREFEAALRLLQDASAHQLLDAIGRLVLVEAGGMLEQRELEPPPDD